MRKCTDTNGQHRKKQLMQDIRRRSLDIEKDQAYNLAQVQYFARSVARLHRRELEMQKLEQELQLIDTDTIYVHIMTDYFEHRVCRVMKGTQFANHDGVLRIRLTDEGRIRVEINGLRLPLHIESSQWIHLKRSSYMITPFLSKNEAYRFKKKNTLR